jgi:hypothetical protein
MVGTLRFAHPTNSQPRAGSARQLDARDASLERDGIRLNHHRALASCLSMIFSENRYTLFRIMR